MRSYEAARSLFTFLGFMAWSVIAIGALVVLIGAGSVSQYAGAGAGLLAMVPGIAIAIAGFILLAFVQMGRATVDSAEYAQQALQISRDQLQVSKQALNGGRVTSEGFASFPQEEATSGGFMASDFAASDKGKHATGLQREVIGSNTSKSSQPKQFAVTHMGKQITLENGKFMTGGLAFDNVDLAKIEIERSQSIDDYRGMSIKIRDGKFHCDRKEFGSYDAACRYIDRYMADV